MVPALLLIKILKPVLSVKVQAKFFKAEVFLVCLLPVLSAMGMENHHEPLPRLQRRRSFKTKQKVTITIPAGIDNGMRLRMPGYGDAGESGGPAGDLYVYVSVKAHEFFERQGDDILMDLPIGFAEAALGCKKEIPTPLSGQVRVTIPEGTQHS